MGLFRGLSDLLGGLLGFVSGLLGGALGFVSSVLRAVLGLVLSLVAVVLLVVAAVLCVTVVLLPVGIPLGALALRLLGQAFELMSPGSTGAERLLRSGQDFFTKRRKSLSKNLPLAR
jgi:hypothetical protein